MITGFILDDKYLWQINLPKVEQEIVELIASHHETEGCSEDFDIDLNTIKKFAMNNFCLEEGEQLTVEEKEFNVTNPWIDRSGRFVLTDEGAVREWGLETVVKFIEKARKVIW